MFFIFCRIIRTSTLIFFFFFNDTATTEIYTLSLTTLFRSLAAAVVLQPFPELVALVELHVLAADLVAHAVGAQRVRGRAQAFLEHAAVVEDEDFELEPGGRDRLDLGERHVARQDHPRDPQIAVERRRARVAAARQAGDVQPRRQAL